MLRPFLAAAVVLVVLAFPAPAGADDWLPHPAGATWTYQWTDSVYNTTPTKEKVTVKETKGKSFVLAWTTVDQSNPPEAPVSLGEMGFQETAAGLLNTDWSSNPPPPSFPILCARAAGCQNSLASTLYNLIWGSRAPVLVSPLLRGAEWTATGGAAGDVTSSADYLGTEQISVLAFPDPVFAAKVRSEVTQAGALGDPYGTGVRTVWWVWGVGPVKIVFEHAGADAPVTAAELVSTSLTPKPPPPDQNYFPLVKGRKFRYRWTNSRHMKRASIQDVIIDEVAGGSARLSVKHVRGPIRVAGAYGFSLRDDGLTNLWGTTQSATLSPFPPLGPVGAPKARRRRFVTPLDLLVYGFNPILPAYPKAGDRWLTKVPSRDFSIFGVEGQTRILGLQVVKVPAGRFSTLVVRSTLKQAGFRFGSGTRTSYFAPGKGLVKLIFRHGDGSVSTVELVR